MPRQTLATFKNPELPPSQEAPTRKISAANSALTYTRSAVPDMEIALPQKKVTRVETAKTNHTELLQIL